MSGFSTVVGFMFAFFIMMGVVIYSFYEMVEDVKDRVDITETNTEIVEEMRKSFFIHSGFSSSRCLRCLQF